MSAIAGPSASKSYVFMLMPISTAPSRAPIHPLSTAPSENAFSLASDYHSPFARIPKHSAPIKTNVAEIASMKPLKFVEIAAAIVAINKILATNTLRFMVCLPMV